jgi:uncharacterized protein YggU (UPF0235/DUF167 family)
MRPWQRAGSGLLLSVRLTPRSASDALGGIETLSDGRAVVKLRVRALNSPVRPHGRPSYSAASTPRLI